MTQLRKVSNAGHRTKSSDAGNPSLIAGGAIVALLAVAAAVGPFWIRNDPLATDLTRVLAPPGLGHWLGCDALGRDLLARTLWGARLSLAVSATVVLLSLTTGGIIGASAALAGGRVDSIVMRAVDVVLAFPGFLLALALAAILGPGVFDLVVALTAMGWTGYARLVRGEVLTLREREFVAAARALGAPPWRLLLRHIFPGLAGPVAVQATFGIGGIIVAEAALSFLGLGARPPTPSWGNMLDSARAFLLVAPHLAIVPGAAIGVSVLGFNLLGDGLAQAIAGNR
jgi:peptide/nickel transport system permease protein